MKDGKAEYNEKSIRDFSTVPLEIGLWLPEFKKETPFEETLLDIGVQWKSRVLIVQQLRDSASVIFAKIGAELSSGFFYPIDFI